MGADRSIGIAEASPQLPLVDFLERLAFSFVVWNAREERRKKKRSRSRSRTERERLDADVATQYLSFAWIQKRSIVSFLDPTIANPQPVEPEGDEHPFPEVCERIAHWTGWPVRQVMAAAHGRFIDHRELVQALNRLEKKGRAAQLYRDFARDYPELAAKIGLVTVPPSPSPSNSQTNEPILAAGTNATAESAGSSANGAKQSGGRGVPKDVQSQRELVFQRYDNFRKNYRILGWSRNSFENFASYSSGAFDDMPSDDPEVLGRMVRAFTRTRIPKRLK